MNNRHAGWMVAHLLGAMIFIDWILESESGKNAASIEMMWFYGFGLSINVLAAGLRGFKWVIEESK